MAAKTAKKTARKVTKVDTVVRHGKSQVTGTTTSVIKLGPGSVTGVFDDAWGVLCEEDGTLLVIGENRAPEADDADILFHAEARADAAQYAAHPERFCGDCVVRAVERGR